MTLTAEFKTQLIVFQPLQSSISPPMHSILTYIDSEKERQDFETDQTLSGPIVALTAEFTTQLNVFQLLLNSISPPMHSILTQIDIEKEMQDFETDQTFCGPIMALTAEFNTQLNVFQPLQNSISPPMHSILTQIDSEKERQDFETDQTL